MRPRFFALYLMAALTIGATVVAGAADEIARPPSDLSMRSSDLSFTVSDLIYRASDIGGKPTDIGGKAKDLEVRETDTEIHIELAADVLFDFDKATLRPSARDALKQAASIIRDNAKGTVRVDGYTDGKGSDAYNQRLSERRADAVKSWLTGKEGLTNVHFETRGFGSKNPVAPNTNPDGSDNPAGRQKNRRVEITVKK
jgi:outer membrane protein OmpA-like peptidoglycan-associated protein